MKQLQLPSLLSNLFLIIIISISVSPIIVMMVGASSAPSRVPSLHQHGSSPSCTSYKGICQADWMSKLPPQIQNKNIREILVLGSHDTGAQAPLNFAATPPLRTKLLNDALEAANNEFTGKYVRPYLNDLTITQPLNVYQQLEQGIRSFDLRITWSTITNKFYLSHSFVAQPLEDTLGDFENFLSRHPGEVLFIQAEYDYEHEEETSSRKLALISLLYQYLGDYFNSQCHNISAPVVTLRNVVASNKRVFFSFHDGFNQTGYYGLCGGGLISTYWPDASDAHDSALKISRHLNETNLTVNTDSFNLIFFTVTADTDSIVEGILKHIFDEQPVPNLEVLSAAMRPLSWNILNNLIMTQKRKGLSIVSVDFPTDDYVQKIINWNLFMMRL